MLLEETISRHALLALSNQYKSVADAVMELVDNPVDYRRGRKLDIEIAVRKDEDTVVVFDRGGEGMGEDELRDWIQWGTGHIHATNDIGQWHVGGKLAAMYLADSLEVVCRKAGTATTYRFRDPHWGSRTSLFSGHPETLDRAEPSHSAAPIQVGFTKITLRRLKPHRYEPAVLISKLANTYRSLLLNGACRISVDGEEVRPLEIPESTVHQPIEIPNMRLGDGVTARGRLWAIDRDRVQRQRGVAIRAGIRTVFNGRLITDGEEFGHYLSGRGSLQRLVGEIHIRGLKPNTTKDNWDRDSHAWSAIEDFMNEQMKPLVVFLNQVGERSAVSREQRKRANDVRRQVEEALRRLSRSTEQISPNGVSASNHDLPLGRKRPEPRENSAAERRGSRERGPIVNRTPSPSDAVGRLLRRYQTGVPPVDFDDLGRGNKRSDWRDSAGGREVVVNTSYPLYAELGETEGYLAETIILHLLREDKETCVLSAVEAATRLDQMLWAWQEVRESTL